MLAVVLALGAVAPTAGRVFKGALSDANSPTYVGKFAFGIDASGAPVGKSAITYSQPASQQGVGFYSYKDVTWGRVYSDGGFTTSCSEALAQTDELASLPSSQSAAQQNYDESSRAYYWFFALASANCVPIKIDYTVTVTQADGSQLSYDEIGMPSIYGCFWAIAAAIFSFHVYLHYVRQPRFMPLISILFSAAFGGTVTSYFCGMINWATLAADGEGVPAIMYIGILMQIASNITMWIVAGLVANGYGIVTYKLSEREGTNWVTFVLIGSAAVIYFAGIIWYAVGRNPANTSSFGGMWPGILLLLLTLLYMGWFIWRIRATILAETHTLKRQVLFRLACTLTAFFCILPFVEFVGGVTPAYYRTRVVAGFDLFVMVTVMGVMTWILSPQSAGEAFKVFDGSSALMLDSDPSGGEFHSAMDEAYAAMDQPAADSAPVATSYVL